jgi:hypothetical protein
LSLVREYGAERWVRNRTSGDFLEELKNETFESFNSILTALSFLSCENRGSRDYLYILKPFPRV